MTRLDEARQEGEWIGRELANALKPGRDVTEAEAQEMLGGPGEIDRIVKIAGIKRKWDGVEEANAFTSAVDAYYDRMTGRR